MNGSPKVVRLPKRAADLEMARALGLNELARRSGVSKPNAQREFESPGVTRWPWSRSYSA